MSDLIKNATEDTFEQDIQAQTPVLVDFWAPWCGPCQRVAPVLEALAKSYDGKLKIVKVNVDECQAPAQKHQIMSIPTLLIFKNGEVVEQIVGALPQAAIEDKIKKHL